MKLRKACEKRKPRVGAPLAKFSPSVSNRGLVRRKTGTFASVGRASGARSGAGVDRRIVPLRRTPCEVVLAPLRPLDTSVGDSPGDESDRPDGVVVAGDDEIDEVGIAVGVGDGDERDVELARFADGDLLLVRI